MKNLHSLMNDLLDETYWLKKTDTFMRKIVKITVLLALLIF